MNVFIYLFSNHRISVMLFLYFPNILIFKIAIYKPLFRDLPLPLQDTHQGNLGSHTDLTKYKINHKATYPKLENKT